MITLQRSNEAECSLKNRTNSKHMCSITKQQYPHVYVFKTAHVNKTKHTDHINKDPVNMKHTLSVSNKEKNDLHVPRH